MSRIQDKARCRRRGGEVLADVVLTCESKSPTIARRSSEVDAVAVDCEDDFVRLVLEMDDDLGRSTVVYAKLPLTQRGPGPWAFLELNLSVEGNTAIWDALRV